MVNNRSIKLPIGGFFPEESNFAKQETFIHSQAIALKSARASLNLILKVIQPKKIYLPFYVCDVILQPIIENNLNYSYYEIDDEFNPRFNCELEEDECFLYINFFGIKNGMSKQLYKKYKEKLILDNTHAFFEKENSSDYSFNSARKFFGVSDGSFLYTKNQEFREISLPKQINKASKKHLTLLKQGKRKLAFQEYRRAEESFDTSIEKITDYSLKLLSKIDMDNVAKIRINNFNRLNEGLKEFNELKFNNLNSQVPFCYPFLPKQKIVRDSLISKQIFFPQLWPNVKSDNPNFKFEKRLASEMFPLPIDHRWGKSEMEYIIKKIKEEL